MSIETSGRSSIEALFIEHEGRDPTLLSSPGGLIDALVSSLDALSAFRAISPLEQSYITYRRDAKIPGRD
ncbi:hypothetical protein ELE36_03115 [Pseudolysobacter antarcticus]|uniref:Uncharacterized protein n=1 Tax=Pseudolysobacter antarcticus TaxID=2511995 RepID=A0A411HG25_9GAMM|nr:hypothetical protein [Pseudolysobacter antarcticus]QBB69445.1 hypothetical protein ELE36_03115 [Pseudolysobacter antarcticus]